MQPDLASLLASSHLDIKVPVPPLPLCSSLSAIVGSNSRRALFFGSRAPRSLHPCMV
jgi:hypothetical protein